MSHQRGRALLLTFDAFGTLFTPRESIAKQYATVARKYDLAVNEDELQHSFRQAYKLESLAHPNYGRDSGLRPAEWWANIIQQTFKPYISPSRPLPENLISDLLLRFSHKEGYRLYPDVKPLFQMIRERNRQSRTEADLPWPWDITVCGIISNSDDRVTSILSSLGLAVRPRTFNGPDTTRDGEGYVNEDVSFTVLSYDVGAEKPDRRMFSAAEHLCDSSLLSGTHSSSVNSGHNDKQALPLSMNYIRLHVGDDIRKDVLGAQSAGWNGVLLDRAGQFAQCFNGQDIITAQAPAASESFSPSDIQVIQDLRALCHWRP